MVEFLVVTFCNDPMIRPIAQEVQVNPEFKKFFIAAMDADDAAVIQHSGPKGMTIMTHVSDRVLHEFYRIKGA